MATPRRRPRFVEEARIMGALDHPNILPVYDLQLDETGGARVSS